MNKKFRFKLFRVICNMLSGSFAQAEVPVWRSCRVAREIPHKLPHFSHARTLAQDHALVPPPPNYLEVQEPSSKSWTLS